MLSWNSKCLEFLRQLHFKNLQIDGVLAHDASLCMCVGVLVINYAESHSSHRNHPPPPLGTRWSVTNSRRRVYIQASRNIHPVWISLSLSLTLYSIIYSMLRDLLR